MENEIPVRKKPAHIVVKSSPISNITYNEYCFQNDLKNNNGCKFFGQKGTLKFQYLRPVIIYCGEGVSPPPPPLHAMLGTTDPFSVLIAVCLACE